METKQKNNTTETKLPNNIDLQNRRNLKITGVEEILTATPTEVVAKTTEGPLVITGGDMKIKNLNNEQKTVEIEGEINELKYSSKKKKFIQKIFR